MSNRKQSSSRALLPLFGLIAAVVAGGLAYLLSAPLENLLISNIPDLPADGSMQLVSGIAIFVLILMVFGILYAVVAPKPKTVHESKLKDEVTKQRSAQKQQRAAVRQNQGQRRPNSQGQGAKTQGQKSSQGKPRPKK